MFWDEPQLSWQAMGVLRAGFEAEQYTDLITLLIEQGPYEL